MADTSKYIISSPNKIKGVAETSIAKVMGLTWSTVVLPTVTTDSISSIGDNTATGGGNVTSDGGASVTARGVCWNTGGSPTTANPKTTDGTGTGTFSSSITSLSTNTTYYVRAYATNSVGTAYGGQVSFTTTGYPSVSYTKGTPSYTTMDIYCNAYSDGGHAIIQRGVAYSSTNSNPFPETDPHVDNGTGTGTYTINLTGLASGTLYYMNVYVINTSGGYYKLGDTFTTSW